MGFRTNPVHEETTSENLYLKSGVEIDEEVWFAIANQRISVL